MTDDTSEKKPKLEVVPPTEEQLDEDERELRAMRRDLPNVKGTSTAGIVALTVTDKLPKNEFFRTHPTFRPVVPVVNTEVGMERQFFSVTDEMVAALASIGITVSDHTLYLTVTPEGAHRIIPISCDSENQWVRTKEVALLKGVDEWVRAYSDRTEGRYRTFPAPKDRYGEPPFLELKHGKIYRLGFRSKGRLIDGYEHPLFLKWSARGPRD